MKKLLLCLPLALFGCMTTSGVISVGKNTYMINVSHSTLGSGFSSHAQLRGVALNKAAEFCTQRNQDVQLNSTISEGEAGWGAIDDEIKFSCIEKFATQNVGSALTVEQIQ